jgi:hypothetical protein
VLSLHSTLNVTVVIINCVASSAFIDGSHFTRIPSRAAAEARLYFVADSEHNCSRAMGYFGFKQLLADPQNNSNEELTADLHFSLFFYQRITPMSSKYLQASLFWGGC